MECRIYRCRFNIGLITKRKSRTEEDPFCSFFLIKIHIIAGIMFSLNGSDYSMLIIQPMTTIAPTTIKIVRIIKITSTYRINEICFVFLTG